MQAGALEALVPLLGNRSAPAAVRAHAAGALKLLTAGDQRHRDAFVTACGPPALRALLAAECLNERRPADDAAGVRLAYGVTGPGTWLL